MLLLLYGVCLAVAQPSYAWLEGESAQSNHPYQTAGWGRAHFLSQSNWLHISIDEDQVDRMVPAGGIVLAYPFNLPAAGVYEVWNRVGFEYVRSPFAWRLDAGDWHPVSPEELTTDLMELSNWCEVAWLKLGERPLSEGAHQLEIRLSKTQDAQGKWQRVLYASDALCVYPGSFRPNSKYRPGQSERTPADQAAARVLFQLPEARAGERSSVSLKGVWEIARDDEPLPAEVAQPIELPALDLSWGAIPVPSDKNVARADLIFAHRLWYRTRVSVPPSMTGRAFYLDFPGNNLNTTVYVNGRYCGFEKNPFVPFQIDVSSAIQAGAVNEIWVGIRDAWYGRAADPKRPLKLRKTFNTPLSFFSDGFQDLDYPVWNCPQSGLLTTPSLVAAGGVAYVADTFVKPSVAQRRLAAEFTIQNTASQEVSGELRWSAVEEGSGRVAKTFTAHGFKVGPGQKQSLSVAEAWADAKLWWPDAPQLYRLRATLVVSGRIVDQQETLFGFREWATQDNKFTLNGVVWHIWADLLGSHASPADWLAAYRQANLRLTRLSTAGQAGHDTRWLGLEPRAALEFCDRQGVVVRRNTTLDGERIGYHFSEPDPETRRQQGGSELKLALMRNWRDQCVAQVKGERNHPSIQTWSLENEFAYINLINLLGNSPNMDQYEEEIARTHDAVMAVDPTRFAMIDGGGALQQNRLSVHGDHYVATLDTRYPDLAYEPQVEGGGRGRWIWDQKRPRFIGEDYFASGINPADYALWGGEAAFQGKASTRPAMALCYRMLAEGYRWGGHYAAWHFWIGDDAAPAQWVANAPRAVFTREWDWTFGSGQPATRTFGIFNDTQHAAPLSFSRRLLSDGKELYAKTTTHRVPPGSAEKFTETIPLPKVAARKEGEMILSLRIGDTELFRDTKAVSILPSPDLRALGGRGLAVFDPAGDTAAYLKTAGVAFTALGSLEAVPEEAKVVLIGRDALSLEDSTSTRLALLAAKGHAVVVLDQTQPLRYQAIPAEIDPAPRSRKNEFGTAIPTAEGRTAFVEDGSHPALRGLTDKDFFTWGPGKLVYRNAYAKPTRGAKSLVQCGPRLAHSALVEVPVGEGVLYLSQLALGGRLADHPVAQHLLVNLLQCAADYRLEFSNVAAVIETASLQHAVDGVGLRYRPAESPLSAIERPEDRIAVVEATAANLRSLATHRDAVQRFWARGGTLMLCGVTPEGLADYNRLVGVDHVLRPFKRERLTFPALRNPLTAGLTTGDIVMLSGKRIFDWTADEYVDANVFSQVLDLEDMAPFGQSGFANYDNIVNGFVGSDGWPLIIDFAYPTNGRPYDIQIDLPREETIVEYTHDASVNYNPTTKIALVFDGRDRVEFTLAPNGEAQTFALEPPRKARRVTLQLVDWLADPSKRPIIGIDNIQLRVARSPEWKAAVRPMLNVGGLAHYPKGPGGVVLCNLQFLDTESVPLNQAKKRTILATILRNLKAPFTGGKTVIAGARLACTPIDIHTKATTYKDERGWFGDRNRTLTALPAGEHTFGGVRYHLYEMPTSPVPQVLMLAGGGVPGNLPETITGIPVNLQADALFFLHTARLDQRSSERDREEGKRFELCRYVVHYADGQSAVVPVLAEVDIEHFVQREPRALPGAQVAWTSRYEGSEESAAVYAKQWNNPRPEVAITTVDLVYGQDKERGVPALLAITAASAE